MLGHISRNGPRPLTLPALPPLHGTSPLNRTPQLRPRTPSPAPEGWGTQQRAGYYFDAGWHSAQTIRRLIRASVASSDTGVPRPPEMLARTLDTLLYSIRPGLRDANDSATLFRQLLKSHLSGLEPDEIAQLSALLTSQRAEYAICETVIDDPMMKKFGFSTGGVDCEIHTLMVTRDLHEVLDDLKTAKASDVQLQTAPRLSADQAAAARNAIAEAARRQAECGITLDELTRVTRALAGATGLSQAPDSATVVAPLPPASCVDWQGPDLLVDLATFAALRTTGDADVYAGLLRDVLELVLVRKLFGPEAKLLSLSGEQRSLLFREIEQVLSRAPAIDASASASESASATAAEILANEHAFGAVQISPTAGVNLGHAWIEPSLSLMPDRSGSDPRQIGTRFMRSGFRLEPTHVGVNEWEARWLDAKENADMYPADRAWQVRVPVPRERLQQAATEIMNEWQRKAVPYRFTGTEPGMRATGCRATVWEATQRGMDDDTRALFAHFRLGLPEPESPTELALRLEQFMDWITTLAACADRTEPH